MRALGVYSKTLVVQNNYLNYKADIILNQQNGSFFLREIKRLGAILFIMPKFDVIHYNSGTTISSAFSCTFTKRNFVRYFYSFYLRLIQKLEFFLIDILHKKIFVTYQGDDLRQKKFQLDNYKDSIAHHVGEDYYDIKGDEYKLKCLSMFEKRKAIIFSVNPDLCNYLTKNFYFTGYSHVFMNEWTPSSENYQEEKCLRILHAPSNRAVKGTDLILESLDQLRSEGLKFELILVEGKSNEEAKELYKKADILIDQIHAGWYGGLSVELMALGKPVACFIRNEDLHFLPSEMVKDLPIINIQLQGLKDDLKKILRTSRYDLQALGKRSRLFVEKWHDPNKISKQILKHYIK
ncbi:MAG: hypothetical protein COV38_03155 [Bdellovibrionales bacterium CG11_big_fil_rev_8_21_14_0_20_38_13]|nr:MAG: hypothetical protein COV38_03155 [Bdellovibrionales bacterium CG11_big_fil_rev_8_21_14_0_20_38_13]